MIIYHIDTVILDIDMRYRLLIWEMTVSIRSSPESIWDILSLQPNVLAPSSMLTRAVQASRRWGGTFH
jgi:hypothetical protein